MTTREFIDSLSFVSSLVKDDLKQGWAPELDEELTESTYRCLRERAIGLVELDFASLKKI